MKRTEAKKSGTDPREVLARKSAKDQNENKTGHKKAGTALPESERRFRDLVELLPQPIFEADETGKLTLTNVKGFETFGYTREDFDEGISIFELVTPKDQTKARENYRRIMQGEKLKENEYVMQKKDGSTFPVMVYSRPIIRQDKIVGVGIAVDMTERKQAEEALRRSEERYRNILESIQDEYFENDLAGNFTFVNDVIGKHLGYTKEELTGMSYRQYTDEETRRKLYQHYNELYRTGGPIKPFEVEYIRKDGTKVFVEISVSLIKDAEGKPIGFRGISRDITERKAAEEAFKRSEHRYRILVESSTDAILMLDLERNISAFNQAFLDMFGYEKSEVEGRSIRIIHLSDESFRSFGDEVYPVVRKSGFFRDEREMKHKNGAILPVETVTSAVKTPDGLILGYIAIMRDITERKRSEEERTTLQEQLRQFQKMEAIGQLAGGIAHDFNNLLTVMKGYTQLSLNEMKESDSLRGNIEEIKKASDRAADLTRQLLAFNRRQIMEVKVLDLNTLSQDLDKMLRRIIGEDIVLAILLGEDLGRVKADPGQIEQVVINLAVNAKDAMSKGGKLIIETANMELDEAYANAHVAVTPGRYVMIAVSDTGAGMPPEVRDRVFEPFFTTKGKGKGTGLGLSTVYGIVKQSGGNIWVYSEPGKGTTLKIYLPRVDEPAEKLKAQVVGEEFPRGSETILIVEDDKEVRKLAVRILTRQGYSVLDGSYGDEAFDVCRQHKGPIHLLLTDVVMPGLDGRALSEGLSKLHPEMKVLYMSGYTEDTVIHRGVMEKGMNYIQKPFTVSGLINKVREVLDR